MKIAENFSTCNFGYENKITGIPHLKQKFKMNIFYLLPLSHFEHTTRLCKILSQKNYPSDLVEIVKEIVKIKVL